MAHRIDLNVLTNAKRAQLVTLMLNYLTDDVVAAHTAITHSGVELFTGHRAYIRAMEDYLLANGGTEFVPLPFWNSANQIPAQFNIVKNPGPDRPPLVNLNPNLPKAARFEYPAVCDYDDPAELGNDVNPWHGSVHCAIGGTMCMLPVASAAPIFWCWHAYVDDIYWDWQRCTVPVPDTTGCTLPIAKTMINAGGLTCGSVMYLPRYATPQEQCYPAYNDPDPTRYCHTAPAPMPSHVHEGGGKGRSKERSHNEHGHMPSPEFAHVQQDYSYLRTGPRVIAQHPSPFTTAKNGTAVTLTITNY